MTKPTKWVCAQRRLRSAWASALSDQSLLSAWRKLGSLATQWAHSQYSDQTGHILGFVMSRLIFLLIIMMCWALSINTISVNTSQLRKSDNEGLFETKFLLWRSFPSRAGFKSKAWKVSTSNTIGTKRWLWKSSLVQKTSHEKTCLCHMVTTKRQISMHICRCCLLPG